MYEKRDELWKNYSNALGYKDAPGYDYTYQALKAAFEAGWLARKTAQYASIVDKNIKLDEVTDGSSPDGEMVRRSE